MLAFALALYPYRQVVQERYADLLGLYQSLPPFAQPAVLLSLTYLVGVVSTRVVLGFAWNFDREGETGFTHRQIRLSPQLRAVADWFYGWWLWLVEIDYRGGSTYRALEAAVPDGVGGFLAGAMIPDLVVQAEIKVARARLSQEAPSLFEELNRAHEEGVFRLAIAPPLLALSLAVWPIIGWLGLVVALMAVFFALVLVRDAAHRFVESNSVLDSALEAGIVHMPFVDRLAEALRENPGRELAIVVEWCMQSDRAWVQDTMTDRLDRVLEWSTPEFAEDLRAELGPGTMSSVAEVKAIAEMDPTRGKYIDRFTDRRIASALYMQGVLRPEIAKRLGKDLE